MYTVNVLLCTRLNFFCLFLLVSAACFWDRVSEHRHSICTEAGLELLQILLPPLHPSDGTTDMCHQSYLSLIFAISVMTPQAECINIVYIFPLSVVERKALIFSQKPTCFCLFANRAWAQFKTQHCPKQQSKTVTQNLVPYTVELNL